MVMLNTPEEADRLAAFLNDPTITTAEALRLFRAGKGLPPPDATPSPQSQPEGRREPSAQQPRRC